MLIYSVPAIMNLNNMKSTGSGTCNDILTHFYHHANLCLSTPQTGSRIEVAANLGMVAMGMLIAVIGGYSTLQGAKH